MNKTEKTEKKEVLPEKYQPRQRDIEALLYDGKNSESVKNFIGCEIDISPINNEIINIFAKTTNVQVLNPGTWVVRDGLLFALYEDADFSRLFEKVEKQPE